MILLREQADLAWGWKCASIDGPAALLRSDGQPCLKAIAAVRDHAEDFAKRQYTAIPAEAVYIFPLKTPSYHSDFAT